MSWLDKIFPPKIKRNQLKTSAVPEGIWSKCEACETVLHHTDLKDNLYVCQHCGYHHHLSARMRIDYLLDPDYRREIGQHITSVDILRFKDRKRYPERLKMASIETGESEAIVIMQGQLLGLPVVVAAFEFKFIGGSMGSAVGERFVEGIRQAVADHIPFICVATSGGARMQEGLSSLMQMAKTSAALQLLTDAKLPFISVVTDPTMGGVSASFVFLGDIIMAEPNALIGFAGPRVIEHTVHETLPEGFQKAEFLLGKGAIDMIVDRRRMKTCIANLISLLMHQPKAF
ncbi:MAG: acetyl-CoA carboxylase carboxyltransferase subunit beta [Neisseriales bacterium]|nr:MAG: acetyl-CoA carboxylase carboxyltransferase subunit beta [Neisseriales bacterium]